MCTFPCRRSVVRTAFRLKEMLRAFFPPLPSSNPQGASPKGYEPGIYNKLASYQGGNMQQLQLWSLCTVEGGM